MEPLTTQSLSAASACRTPDLQPGYPEHHHRLDRVLSWHSWCRARFRLVLFGPGGGSDPPKRKRYAMNEATRRAEEWIGPIPWHGRRAADVVCRRT